MSTEPMQVELGWPEKALSPNARVHFMSLSRAKKKAREEAYWATKVVKPLKWEHDGERMTLRIIAYPPDKRSRDDDNLVSSCKAHRDGIAQALGIDDKLFDQQPVIWAEPVRDGRIVMVLG